MAFSPLENLLPKTGNSIYRLVAMASKRAMELADNAPRLIENPTSMKIATIALEEIASEKVTLKMRNVKVTKAPDAEKSLKAESVSV